MFSSLNITTKKVFNKYLWNKIKANRPEMIVKWHSEDSRFNPVVLKKTILLLRLYFDNVWKHFGCHSSDSVEGVESVAIDI